MEDDTDITDAIFAALDRLEALDPASINEAWFVALEHVANASALWQLVGEVSPTVH